MTLGNLRDLGLGCDLPQRLGHLAGRESQAMEKPDPSQLHLSILNRVSALLDEFVIYSIVILSVRLFDND